MVMGNNDQNTGIPPAMRICESVVSMNVCDLDHSVD